MRYVKFVESFMILIILIVYMIWVISAQGNVIKKDARMEITKAYTHGTLSGKMLYTICMSSPYTWNAVTNGAMKINSVYSALGQSKNQVQNWSEYYGTTSEYCYEKINQLVMSQTPLIRPK